MVGITGANRRNNTIKKKGSETNSFIGFTTFSNHFLLTLLESGTFYQNDEPTSLLFPQSARPRPITLADIGFSPISLAQIDNCPIW